MWWRKEAVGPFKYRVDPLGKPRGNKCAVRTAGPSWFFCWIMYGNCAIEKIGYEIKLTARPSNGGVKTPPSPLAPLKL